MATLPTRLDYFQIGADEVLARSDARPIGQRISADEVFTEGSDINIVIASASAMAEEITRQIALRESAFLLDSAENEDLDRLVADRFSPTIVRKEASPAVATLSFSRSTGALPAISESVGFRVRTENGTEFRTTSVFSLGAGETGPVQVPAEAAEAGISGNVAANTIIEFISSPSDSNLLVTNPNVAAGGDSRETDARLRERARDFFLTARRGTLQAIEFGALTVGGVRQATAIEDVDQSGDPTGRVSLFIADSQGQANQLLVSAVRSALIEYRAAGVVVDVIASSPTFVPIQYRLRFEPGINTLEAFSSVQVATVSAVNRLLPQETLPVSLLFEAARSVPGVIVLEDAVLEPVGDVIPAVGQVIRTRNDLVTAE